MAPTVVLISGTNRGVGKGILKSYLAKPDHFMIAANRDPESPSSEALFDLPVGTGTRLLMSKVDASVESDAFEAVNKLAAHCQEACESNRLIEVISRNQSPFPNAAYAPTKLAAHWFTKMNAEEDRLNAFFVDPGFCQTDLGNGAANRIGLEKALVPVEESSPRMVQLIDGVTKESHGGGLWNYTGSEMAC